VTTVVVAAAIVERGDLVLVTQRQAGGHLPGVWEFPGGKCHAGESLPACLARELLEELDLQATVREEVFSTSHDYGDRRVELHFFRCEGQGEPVPQLGQHMRWVSRSELAELEFPPADAELIDLLKSER
jgi:8-oxo-dGTP diphosphatase